MEGVWGQILRKWSSETSPYPDSHTRHFLKNAKLFRFVKYLVSV
mgnify:CR=1|nr:MAG TPA: ATP synthase [Caudoviricetes sp.]DAT22050.1 MAG TPA: ATP synthase [Caudoviricetes sp.]